MPDLDSILGSLQELMGNQADDEEEPDDDDSEDQDNDPDDVDEQEVPEDVDQRVGALETQLADLEDHIQQVEGSVKTVQGRQEQSNEKLDVLEDHTQKLLGIYDSLVGGVNPLSQAKNTDPSPEPDEETTEDEDSEESPFMVPGLSEGEVPEETSSDDTESTSDSDADETPTNPLFNLNPQANTEEKPEPEPEEDDSEYIVAEMGHNLRVEFVAFEWLDYLLREAGTTGAIETLAYYERLNWISPSVRKNLSRRVLGPVYVDGFEPQDQDKENLPEPTHEESYKYIQMLSKVSK